MKTFLQEFTQQKGWAHFSVMIAIIYVLIFWGNTEYAQTTKLWPSEMIADLTTQHWFWQWVIFTAFAYGLGFMNEWCQGTFLNVKNWQMSDIWSGMIGVPVAMIVANYYLSLLGFWIAIAFILLSIAYNVQLVYKKLKK